MIPQDTDTILRAIGRRIAEIRSEKGWTQEDFTERACISPRYLQDLEGGKQNFSIKTLNRLAKLLGVPFEALLVPPRDMETRPGRPRRR